MLDVDALPEGSFIFQRGGWQLMPDAPVLVDHDQDRPIGVVRSLSEFEDVDGTWLMAHTTIDDPPCWLGRETPASITYSAYEHGTLEAARRQRHR